MGTAPKVRPLEGVTRRVDSVAEKFKDANWVRFEMLKQ
jgi:hypothetical protein